MVKIKVITMVTAIIELGIGYFVTYHVSDILELKSLLSKSVKAVGIILLLLGFVNLVESLSSLLNIS